MIQEERNFMIIMMLPKYDKDELITLDQAFQALTINGAWQLGLENEVI